MEVKVDEDSVQGLWKLGLPAACPNVNKLTLLFPECVSSDIVKEACSSWLHLTDVRVGGVPQFSSWPSIHSSVSFCDAISCPQLTNLTIINFELGNSKAGRIIERMTVHKGIKSVEYVHFFYYRNIVLDTV